MVTTSTTTEQFPDGPFGGYAFTYHNVMQQHHGDTVLGETCFGNPETIYLNLALAINQINELKKAMNLPADGLTYTGAQFDAVVTLANADLIDLRLISVDVQRNTPQHSILTGPDLQDLDGHTAAAVTEGYQFNYKLPKSP